MEGYVDTDTEALRTLQKKLDVFREQTEIMRMLSAEEMDEFEMIIHRYRENQNEPDDGQFEGLWRRYENCRDIFESGIDRLMQNEIVNGEGRRNIYTLINVLEEYLKLC